MIYEYNEDKNQRNIKERGISFNEAKHFDFASAFIAIDTRIKSEIRFKTIGFIKIRLHVLIYTLRGEKVRIISLRKANKREVALYEQRS